MTEYMTTAIAMSIHPTQSHPVYGELSTHIRMTDEGSGPFFEISQDGKAIRVDVDEIRALLAAAETMISQPGANEEDE